MQSCAYCAANKTTACKTCKRRVCRECTEVKCVDATCFLCFVCEARTNPPASARVCTRCHYVERGTDWCSVEGVRVPLCSQCTARLLENRAADVRFVE